MDSEERLARIEERLSAIELKLSKYGKVAPAQSIVRPPPMPKAEASIHPMEVGPEPLSPLFETANEWIKTNWMASIGIFLVLMAAGWFVSYAFTNDLISETVRIALCLTGGFACYIAGFVSMIKSRKNGSLLMILGEAVLLVSLYAGYYLYGITTELTTIAAMVAITGFTTLLAVIRNLEGLGTVSLVAAISIPFLIENSIYFSKFAWDYFLVLDLAALTLFMARGWIWSFHASWFATLSCTFVYLFTASFWHFEVIPVLLYLIFAFPAVMIACGKFENRLSYSSALTLLVATLFILYCGAVLENKSWVNAVFPALAVISFLCCYAYAYNWERLASKSVPTKYVLGSVWAINIMSLVGLLLSYNLSHIYLIDVVLLLQVVLAMGVALFLLKAPTAAAGLAAFMVYPLMNIFMFSRIAYAPFNSPEFTILWTTTVLLGIASWIAYEAQRRVEPAEKHPIYGIVLSSLFVIMAIAALILTWNVSHNIFTNPNIARSVALTLYIIAAEFLIYLGNLKGIRNIRYGGMVLIIMVVYQLLFIEVWEMPIVIRTVTFVITGLLLIGTTWLDKRSSRTN